MIKEGRKENKRPLNGFITVFLLILCVVVLVLLAVVARNVAALNDLKHKLNALEEEKILDLKPLGNQIHDYGTGRIKRAAGETNIEIAMAKLETLERRYCK